EGSMVISVVGMPGMSLEESVKTGKNVEQLLLELPEVEVVSRRTGRAELDEHAQGVNAAELDAPFQLDAKSKEAFFEEVRAKLAAVPGVNITIGQPIAHRIDHMLSGTRANIAIKIFGDDLSKLYEIGKEIEHSVEAVPGIVDLALDQQIEVPQIRVSPKRQLLTAYGLSTADFLNQMEIGLAGKKAAQLYEGQRYYDLVVRLQTEARDEINDIKEVPIFLPNGAYLPLEQLAEVKSLSSANSIARENVQRKIVLSANVQGRDLRGAVEEIQSLIEEQHKLPEAYRVEYGGQFESEARASDLLLWSAGIAILIIFLLLFFEFKNFQLAFIVLLNLPLALIGGIVIVYLSSGIVSIASTIGFISLFGIATRNGILLVSRYEDLKKAGMKGLDLMKKGALDRLNPILMTAFTTGLALIPLALKGSEAGN
ncbi:MAG: efflux RND transporter permease subunit, partial [Croceimicrobium sp.]